MAGWFDDSKGFLSTERLSRGPWQAFERAIARFLGHAGWELNELVGGKGDNGADIIAAFRSADGDLHEYIYQAKFSETNRPINVDIIGDLKRAMEFYGITNGIATSNRVLSDSQERKRRLLIDNGYNIDTFLSGGIFKAYGDLPSWPTEVRILKEFQVEALQALQEAFTNGDRRAMICLATGLGKTFVAASFIRFLYEQDHGLNILVLANSKSLIEQFDRGIWSNLPKWISTHLVYESEKPAFLEGVTLSTFQSFPQFLKSNGGFTYDVVIVDEAHHAPADTYKKVLSELSPRLLVGLTATPFRADQRDVKSLFGSPLVHYSVHQALLKGFLARVEYQLLNDNVDQDWISQNSRKGHTIKQLNKKVFLPERDEIICDRIHRTWTSRSLERGIIFCNSSEHAERIEKLLRVNYQIPTWSLTTRVKDARERARRLRQFRTGECKVLTCYDMLNEGVDVPDVDYIVFLRVTHSRVYFLQQLGRGLRYKEGKVLLVEDYVADIRRLKRVKQFNRDMDEARKREIENLYVNNAFRLEFSSEQTTNFIDLVTRDITEEMDEDDEVMLSELP